MYHKASISPLSSTQISKILNGHSVRVSAGNGHDIELSKEQLKKFAKAQKTGKGMTLTMDPFQMQNHQYLRGSGNVKKTAKGSAKRLIVSATDRAIRALDGSGVNRLKKAKRWEQFANATVRDGIDTAGKAARVYYDSTDPMAQMGFGIGGNIKAVAKDSGKRLIISGTNRAIRAIDGSGINGRLQHFMESNREGGATEDARNHGKGIGDVKKSFLSGTEKAINTVTGGSVNRLKKAGRWEHFANATLRDGIDTAGKAARVYYDSTNPMAQMGFGLRKRKAPKRRRSKSGGALYPAGIP